MALARYILLGVIPGLMFCVIPVDGMPFRFSWQLVSIWLAAVIFAIWLSSWWYRIFFLMALMQIIIHGPVTTAYISLVAIGIFLAAAEGFVKLESHHVLNMIALAGILLTCWIHLQVLGILPRSSLGDAGMGPFNKNAASVFIAVSLPAFFRGRICMPSYLFRHRGRQPICWWHLAPFVACALVMCRSTSGLIAGAAGTLGFFVFSRLRLRMILAGIIGTALLTTLFFWKVDPISKSFTNDRWLAWKHITWSFRSAPVGRGLDSFRHLFPCLISGDSEMQGLACGKQWAHAHNEYLQLGFEMGPQATALVLTYLLYFFANAWRMRKKLSDDSKIVIAGIAALAISCMGWHTFHIPPLAVLGVAWLGQARRIVREA